MNINELRNELSIRSKNGLPFLMSASLIWLIILFIYVQSYEIVSKNILSFYATGLMFPLAILISKVIKAEWKTNDNPLGMLGLYMNLAQLIYFPLIIWAFSKNPDYMIVFFAIITGAHLFPYGWFYNTKAYIIMAPIISIFITIVGWNINSGTAWQVPLGMVILLVVLSIWLYIDYKIKVSQK